MCRMIIQLRPTMIFPLCSFAHLFVLSFVLYDKLFLTFAKVVSERDWAKERSLDALTLLDLPTSFTVNGTAHNAECRPECDPVLMASVIAPVHSVRVTEERVRMYAGKGDIRDTTF